MAPKPKFGIVLSSRGVFKGWQTPEEFLQLAEMVDSSEGFSHVWVGDTIMSKPRAESITMMAGIAARTKRVKIGVACMASFSSRNPVVLAYQWASLDVLSGGRMILGPALEAPSATLKTFENTGTWVSWPKIGRPEWKRA